jgi:hypothetical protein
VFRCVSGGTGADHARVLFEEMQSARGTWYFELYIRSCTPHRGDIATTKSDTILHTNGAFTSSRYPVVLADIVPQASTNGGLIADYVLVGSWTQLLGRSFPCLVLKDLSGISGIQVLESLATVTYALVRLTLALRRVASPVHTVFALHCPAFRDSST